MEMDDETEVRIVEKVEYIREAVTVLSTETAEAMQEAARFRNVLAHTYGHDIDDERVFRHLQNDLHWFPTFLREVREVLDEQ